MPTEPRKMTPDEVKDFDARMEASEPLRIARQNILLEQKVVASETIAMLQRRTHQQTTLINLEGGDTIRIFSRMSEADLKRIEAIEDERLEYIHKAELAMVALNAIANPEEIAPIKKEIDGYFAMAGDCWLRVIALITVDPSLTYEWLKANPDMYSPEDITDAYLAYREARKYQIAERAERVKRAITFRDNKTG